MVKESLSSFCEKETIRDGEFSTIYRLSDGRLLKVLKENMLKEFEATGIPFAHKLTNPLAEDIDDIVKTETLVYDDALCCGYTMNELPGNNLEQWDKGLPLKESLEIETYYAPFANMSKGCRKCDSKGIVLPDLATASNTMILPDGRICFLDREGMQFGKADLSFMVSNLLGNPKNYITSSKYTFPYCLTFKPELNKTSLTYLIFLCLFHADLSKVGQMDPVSRTAVTLNDVFQMIGLTDKKMMKKVEQNLSFTKNGEYLEKDIYRLMKNYSLEKYDLTEDAYIKRLTPKRAK